MSSVGQQVSPRPLCGRPDDAQDRICHSLLSAGTSAEQHNGPLRLILMSYLSSPHYPCYWLVWSQPGTLKSNNKRSFFSLVPSHPSDSHILWGGGFLFIPQPPCTLHSWFIDQRCGDTTETVKPWSAPSHRMSRSSWSVKAELFL